MRVEYSRQFSAARIYDPTESTVTQGLTGLRALGHSGLMTSNPGGDSGSDTRLLTWTDVLAHRVDDPSAFEQVVARLTGCGLSPQHVHEALADGGDALYAAAQSGSADWSDAFGGPLAVALLAAEVGALAAHLNWRASGIRSLAVDALLEDFSAVAVAGELGVARQKVYEIAKGGLRPPYIENVPWRTP